MTNKGTGRGLYIGGCVDSEVLAARDRTNGETEITTAPDAAELIAAATAEVDRAAETEGAGIDAENEVAPHPRVAHLGGAAIEQAIRQFE